MTVVALLRFLPLALLLSSSFVTAADKPFVARDLIGMVHSPRTPKGPPQVQMARCTR